MQTSELAERERETSGVFKAPDLGAFDLTFSLSCLQEQGSSLVHGWAAWGSLLEMESQALLQTCYIGISEVGPRNLQLDKLSRWLLVTLILERPSCFAFPSGPRSPTPKLQK